MRVHRTHEARRAEAAQALVKGPLATLGLGPQLAAALEAERQRDFVRASRGWGYLSKSQRAGCRCSSSGRCSNGQARALSELNDRRGAVAIYRRLARERLELDDPSAEFDLHREFWGGGQRDFEFALLSVRAGASEQGRDSLDALRGLHDEAPTSAMLPPRWSMLSSYTGAGPRRSASPTPSRYDAWTRPRSACC